MPSARRLPNRAPVASWAAVCRETRANMIFRDEGVARQALQRPIDMIRHRRPAHFAGILSSFCSRIGQIRRLLHSHAAARLQRVVWHV